MKGHPSHAQIDAYPLMWPLGQGNGGDSVPPIAALDATEPASQKMNEFQTATTAANDPNAE
jgi:hypothetical protein